MKEKKHDKIVLFAKTKLNSIEILIPKASIDSDISHDKLNSINNMLKNMKIWKKKSES